MKIAMIGSGGVGKALAVALRSAGHQVEVGTRSPDDEELRSWSTTSGVAVDEVGAVAAAAEVVVLATAWGGAQNALSLAGDSLAGKVLVDVTNPLQFTDRLGLAIGHSDSGGEQVQRWAPQAKVVKAFNTVGFELMDHPRTSVGAPTLFVATDDDDAKAVATTLAADLGWSVHDCGGLRGARLTEPMALLWIEHAMRSGTRNHVLTFVTTRP
ncbi:MAG: NADPH-dependent F420 reductase [Acidimicrobiales bacterium]